MLVTPEIRNAHRATRPPAVRGVPASSVAFFSALHRSGVYSPLPHPVHARNASLVDAWLQWGPQQLFHLDAFLRNSERRFPDNRDLINEAVRADPAHRSGQVILPADRLDEIALMARVTAPLMFWSRANTILELTPALEQWLVRSDLGADIPFDFLRPPAPACFIRFGDHLQQAILPLQTDQGVFNRVDGAYVFESFRDGRRIVALLPVYAPACGAKGAGVGMFDMIVEDEALPLVEAIKRIDHSNEFWQHSQSVAQLCVKVFLYLRAAQAQQVGENLYSKTLANLQRVGQKKAAKVHRQLEKLYDRIILGPQTVAIHAHGEHGEVSPHWRRGHFRMQPHGRQNQLRKVLFIAPMLVRGDRLAQAPAEE